MPAVRPTLARAATILADAGVGSPEHDARELFAFVLGVDRLPFDLESLDDTTAERFDALIARRAAREPLQHITGSTVFRYLTLEVRPGVFVPRPETEVVAQVAIDEASAVATTGRAPVVVDLCCGTGPIALAVATEVPRARVAAVDLTQAAVDLTRANAATVGASAVRVEQGDVRDEAVLADLNGTVDVLISNPPYIPPGAIPIDPEVRDYDPTEALFGGGVDGLEVPRAVLAAAARLLKPGGLLVMEHADVQGEEARRAAAETGAWLGIETRADLTGRDRMLVARRA